MKHSQFLKFMSLLMVLPLLFLPGCNDSGDQAMQNNQGQNNQGRQNNNNQNAAQQSDTHVQTYPDEQTAAKNGLETLAKLVDAENFKDMGFASVEEARSATLGVPLKMFLVRLDQLREYKVESDPKALLTDVHRSLYPVMVGGEVRSSIAVEEQGGKWSAVSFGDSSLIKKIDGVVKKLPKESADQPVIVHVAFLNLYFVGQNLNSKLMLTTLTPLPDKRLTDEGTVPAALVFVILLPIAKEHEGLPG